MGGFERAAGRQPQPSFRSPERRSRRDRARRVSFGTGNEIGDCGGMPALAALAEELL